MKVNLDIPIVSIVFIGLVLLTFISIVVQRQIDGELIKQNVEAFFKRVILYIISIFIISIFCILFFYIKELVPIQGIKDIIGTGIITALFLPLIGFLIRFIYYKFLDFLQKKKIISISNEVPESIETEIYFEKVFVGATFVSGAFLLLYDNDVLYFLYIITIILGKYLWINTSMKKILSALTNIFTLDFISDNIFDIVIILGTLIIMLLSNKLSYDIKFNMALGIELYVLICTLILFIYIKWTNKKYNNNK